MVDLKFLEMETQKSASDISQPFNASSSIKTASPDLTFTSHSKAEAAVCAKATPDFYEKQAPIMQVLEIYSSIS